MAKTYMDFTLSFSFGYDAASKIDECILSAFVFGTMQQ